MNVLPIEGRNKCLVQFRQDGMSEFIALTFDAPDLVDLLFDILVVGEQVHQRTSPGDEVVRHQREHLKETIILRKETEHLRIVTS